MRCGGLDNYWWQQVTDQARLELKHSGNQKELKAAFEGKKALLSVSSNGVSVHFSFGPKTFKNESKKDEDGHGARTGTRKDKAKGKGTKRRQAEPEGADGQDDSGKKEEDEGGGKDGDDGDAEKEAEEAEDEQDESANLKCFGQPLTNLESLKGKRLIPWDKGTKEHVFTLEPPRVGNALNKMAGQEDACTDEEFAKIFEEEQTVKIKGFKVTTEEFNAALCSEKHRHERNQADKAIDAAWKAAGHMGKGQMEATLLHFGRQPTSEAKRAAVALRLAALPYLLFRAAHMAYRQTRRDRAIRFDRAVEQVVCSLYELGRPPSVGLWRAQRVTTAPFTQRQRRGQHMQMSNEQREAQREQEKKSQRVAPKQDDGHRQHMEIDNDNDERLHGPKRLADIVLVEGDYKARNTSGMDRLAKGFPTVKFTQRLRARVVALGGTVVIIDEYRTSRQLHKLSVLAASEGPQGNAAESRIDKTNPRKGLKVRYQKKDGTSGEWTVKKNKVFKLLTWKDKLTGDAVVTNRDETTCITFCAKLRFQLAHKRYPYVLSRTRPLKQAPAQQQQEHQHQPANRR